MKIRGEHFMDSKTLSQLDPKLQETYARVMGTPTNASPAVEPNQNGSHNASPSIFSTPPAPVDETPPLVPTPPSSGDTAVAEPSPQPISAVEPPAPDTTSVSDALSPVTPITPYTATPTAEGQPASANPQPFAQPLPSPAEVNQAENQKEASPLLRVLYILGAVIFFAIYTIFWIKVFNLPFLF